MPNQARHLPCVSVVVSNFNGAKYLPKLLETLHAQQGAELEIIVVDRNSADESAAILAAHSDVKVVLEPPESGLVAGYAVGAEQATTDLLFFCNEDMWFEPDCLRLLAGRIDLRKRVAAADPWQWTYDGQTWIHGGTRFRSCLLCLNCPYPFRQYDFVAPLADGEPVPFGCAGAVMVHRAVYEELGGWDRGFFLDHEDVDFFLRVWQAGWKVVTVPNAKVYHAVNVSNKNLIDGGGQLVGRRRYISGRASLPIIAVKYFSAGCALSPLLMWAAATIKHTMTLKLRQSWWDVLAGKEFLIRFPAALRQRRARAVSGCPRKGEKFFTAPEFQAPGKAVE